MVPNTGCQHFNAEPHGVEGISSLQVLLPVVHDDQVDHCLVVGCHVLIQSSKDTGNVTDLVGDCWRILIVLEERRIGAHVQERWSKRVPFFLMLFALGRKS
jgi:hypothetical protein